MASEYPGALDSFSHVTDDVDDVEANDINELQDAIEAIQGELGTDPAGDESTVKDRLRNDNKARAYLSGSAQSIPKNTWTKLQLNGESYDPGEAFDSSSDYDYTVPSDGYYLVKGKVSLNSLSSGDKIYLRINKNGTQILQEYMVAPANDNIQIMSFDIMDFDAGDLITMSVYHNHSAGALDAGPGVYATYLTVHKMSD